LHVTRVLDSTHKLWRGIAFRDKVFNFKVYNVSKLLGEQTWWRSDAVHPTVEGYNRVATFITKGFRTMLDKGDGTESNAGGDGSAGSSSKGAAEESMSSAPKRPAWLSRSENYVTRRDNVPFRGRGGSGGGGGRAAVAGGATSTSSTTSLLLQHPPFLSVSMYKCCLSL
jgi:uncharacterized membrane protein YgcG